MLVKRSSTTIDQECSFGRRHPANGIAACTTALFCHPPPGEWNQFGIFKETVGPQTPQDNGEVHPPMQVLSSTSASSDCRHGDHLPDQHTIGQLFRDYGEEYIRVYRPSRRTIQLIRSIRLCRTPALGGQRIRCKQCGYQRYQYFSCGNSHCPQCQGIKRLQWQDRLANRLLQVPYCHTTFTLPHQLNGLARRNLGPIYNLLLRSCWKTIAKLCADEDNVGAKPGMTAVLHTWGSDLKYHVHVHCLITFGGLTTEQVPQWKWPRRKNKVAPYRKMCSSFRSTFLEGLKRLMDAGQISYHLSFNQIQSEVITKRWVVHNTFPTAETKVIEEYLGRYICRIGISNKRLHYDQNGKNVRIEYNDYANQKSGQAAPKKYRNVLPLVAMQLLLQHQLPLYFQKVRHYGLHATNTYRKIKKHIPHHLKRNGQTVRTVIQILRALLAKQPHQCQHCGSTNFEVEHLATDRTYLKRHILLQGRSPPSGQADKAGSAILPHSDEMSPVLPCLKSTKTAGKASPFSSIDEVKTRNKNQG